MPRVLFDRFPAGGHLNDFVICPQSNERLFDEGAQVIFNPTNVLFKYKFTEGPNAIFYGPNFWQGWNELSRNEGLRREDVVTSGETDPEAARGYELLRNLFGNYCFKVGGWAGLSLEYCCPRDVGNSFSVCRAWRRIRTEKYKIKTNPITSEISPIP